MADVELDLAAQDARLQATAEKGAALRRWFSDPAYKIIESEMNRLAGRDNMRWLTVTDEDAAKMREEAKPYARFFQVVKAMLLDADNASRILEERAQRREAPPREGQGA